MSAKDAIQQFLDNGYSLHSAAGRSVSLITEYCRKKAIPYRVDAAREKGRIIGFQVFMTDAPARLGRLPLHFETETIEEWRGCS